MAVNIYARRSWELELIVNVFLIVGVWKMSSVASSNHLTVLADDKPNQRNKLHFPQREFGKASVVLRSFPPQCFKRWLRLHYREEGWFYVSLA